MPGTTNLAFDELRSKGTLIDVTLIVNEKRIIAHKIILSVCSPYFLAMFAGSCAESDKSIFTLSDFDDGAVETIVDFAYKNEIDITSDNVQALLATASKMLVTEVQRKCCHFIAQQLDPSNCIGVREIADKYSCLELKKVAHSYIIESFEDVSKGDEFVGLPLDQLIEIMSDEGLNLKSEEVAFEAVMRWIKADRVERIEYLSDLMQHVHLSQLSPRYLAKTVCQDRLIRANEKCRDYIEEAMSYMLLPEERAAYHAQHARFRPRYCLTEKLYSIGGMANKTCLASVEKYDPDTDQWTFVKEMNDARSHFGAVVLDNKLYAVGGHNSSLEELDTIEIYDPSVDKWLAVIVNMPTPRVYAGVAALNGCLYVIGGNTENEYLNTVDRYDPSEGVWYSCRPMNTERAGLGVVTLSGYIYAIGGYDSESALDTVERYDPATDKWTFVANMPTKCSDFGCVAFDGMIYAVGYQPEFELALAERFDPHYDRWESIELMKSSRGRFGLAVIRGKIYAVGGRFLNSSEDTVEVYDPHTKHWSPCKPMHQARDSSGVAVMLERIVTYCHGREHNEKSASIKDS